MRNTAVGRGLRVIIAGAGGAAHLPGMMAAKTVVPVLGVPIAATALQGMDSLLSIVQMPKGIPVGTLAIGASGAANAASARGCNTGDDGCALRKKLVAWRAARRDEVLAQAHGRRSGWTREVELDQSAQPILARLDHWNLRRRTAWPDDCDGRAGHGLSHPVLDPDPACPARFVVDGCIEAGWDDSREAANLARGCDVVTLEIEQISAASMDAAASFAPVRPGGAMLAIIQDRIEQKDWLRRNGFPVGEYRAVRSLDECARRWRR